MAPIEQAYDTDEELSDDHRDAPSPYDLLRHRFKSKVGGRPAWLDPVHLPPVHLLTCSVTFAPRLFLLQVYAPPEAAPQAFHRVVMLFISPQGGSLTQPDMVKALRTQLPLHNEYYAPYPEGGKLPTKVMEAHIQDPWQVGVCEAALAAQAPLPAAQGVQLLQEHELVVDEEPECLDDEAMLSSTLEQQRLAGCASLPNEDTEMAADMAMVEASTDPEQQHYARFAARVARAPQQVLRYCFDDGCEPLWPCRQQPQLRVPPCSHCKGRRRFEFQVMPQLLNYLGVQSDDKQAPDWGTIAVYSCAASCATADSYVEEFVYVQ